MSIFDAYHKWLGIPPAEQPPHYYRLLGVAPFEADLDVIEAGADRQMTHIRQCAIAQYEKESKQILNEISAARVCLLNPSKKKSYDTELEARIKTAPLTAAPAAAPKKAPAGRQPEGGITAPKAPDGMVPAEVAQQERRARKLLDEQDYDAAIPLLVKLKDLQSTLFKDTSTWAKGALPVAKQKQEKLRARVTAACEKARQLLKEYHYGEVSEMLEGLPLPARTDEARRLLKLAGEAFDDYMGLQQEIDDALKAKNYEHLLPLVKRYIKLKPDNSKMQRLAQDLARNRPDRAVKNYKGTGKYFDVAGRLVEPMELVGGLILIVALVAGVSFGARHFGKLREVRNLMSSTSPTGGQESTGGGTSQSSNSDDSAKRPSETPPKAPEDSGSRPAGKIGLEIVKAEFGAGSQQKDVTDVLRKHVVGDWPLISLPEQTYAAAFGEPPSGSPKELKVDYKIKGKAGKVSFVENAPIVLPVPPQDPVTLEIIKANYLAGNENIDVAEILRKHASDSPLITLPTPYYDTVFGHKPKPGEAPIRNLMVNYRINDTEGDTQFRENDVIELPLPLTDDERQNRLQSGIEGEWFEGGERLISPAVGYGRHLLYRPAGEYTLSMKVRALPGNVSPVLQIGLPLPDTQKHVIMYIDYGSDPISGLALVDRKELPDNPTVHKGRVLPSNRDVTIICTVKKNSIVCTCDGVKFVDWNDDFARFSLWPGYHVMDKKGLFLGIMFGRIAFSNIKVSQPGNADLAAASAAPAPVTKETRPAGEWIADAGWLVSPPDPLSVFKAFDQKFEEYSVVVRAMRLTGDQTFAICLPILGGQKQALVVIDANRGTVSGLESIDGKLVAENETAHKGRMLLPKREVQVVCTVRKKSITCWCGGVKFVDWRGDMNTLSLPPGWTFPDSKSVYLATQDCSIATRGMQGGPELNHKIEVGPLPPEPGDKMPKAPPATKPAAK